MGMTPIATAYFFLCIVVGPDSVPGLLKLGLLRMGSFATTFKTRH